MKFFNIKNLGYKLMRLALVAGVISISSCEKMLEVDTPVNQLVSASVFKDSTTAQAAVNGLYSLMYNGTAQLNPGFYSSNSTTIPAKAADELFVSNNDNDAFVTNTLLSNDGDATKIWTDNYQLIYSANSIIEGMEASALTPTLKRQLIGEAKFMRGFLHFTLVNYFGDVPLITTKDVTVNNTSVRTPASVVYAQVIADLKDAKASLAIDYSWSQNNRTRVNRYVAAAMLSRVYLYNSNWELAEQEATEVIGQNAYTLPTNLSQIFIKGSKEAIWEFHTNLNGYTYTANTLLPNGNLQPVYVLRPQLMSAFEPGDLRQSTWTRTYTSGTTVSPYAYKYTTRIAGNGTENEIVMRLAEQYLIRAEARIRNNNIAGGIADLNILRARARAAATAAIPNPLPALSASLSQADALLAVEHERQVELFVEWGHRWFDLKRTNRANTLLPLIPDKSWQATDALLPITESLILGNPNLVPNPGY